MNVVSETPGFNEKPRITLTGALLVLAVFILYTVFTSLLLIQSDPDAPTGGAIFGSILNNLIKLILIGLSWWVIVREGHRLAGWLKMILHGVAGLAVAFGSYYGFLGLIHVMVGPEAMRGSAYVEENVWIIFSNFLEYAIVFSIIHIIESITKLNLREKQALQYQELANRRQIQTLKAQLNPHFLFNTLNSISAAASQDVQKTRSMLEKLSEMLRYSFNSYERDLVKLEEELQFVRKYLELEKSRFGERLSFRFEIDEQFNDHRIPPMIIQPLVENAVRHGIAPLEDGGEVILRVNSESDGLSVSVEDTGSGMPEVCSSNSSGVGLRNTNQLLKHRYGGQYGLQVRQLEPSGTQVCFKIPAKVTERADD